MPEVLEVEYSRRLVEARAVGRTIRGVDAPDAWYLKRGLTADVLTDAVMDRKIVAARRRGKLLLLDTGRRRGDPRGDTGPTIGLHFGMTGRLLIDDVPALERLEYGSDRQEPAWDRIVLYLGARGVLLVRDPRRLGAVELDPDEDRLGVDAFALTPATYERAARASRAPLKAVLMDQSRIAGLGNLLTDEILWRCGLGPNRPAAELDPAERRRLVRVTRQTLDDLLARGGSHTGDLMAARLRGGTCPRDGAALVRETVGGRTTYWCPRHQR